MTPITDRGSHSNTQNSMTAIRRAVFRFAGVLKGHGELLRRRRWNKFAAIQMVDLSNTRPHEVRPGETNFLLTDLLEKDRKHGPRSYEARLPLPDRDMPGYAPEVDGWIRFYGRHGCVRVKDRTKHDDLYLVRHAQR